MQVTTIGLDADDTLWENEQFFRLTEERFAEILSDHAERRDVSAQLLEAEKRNLKLYGFGIKGFILSMIETAIDVTAGNISSQAIARILEIGREMLQHPIDTLPHVTDTLERLAPHYRLVLITKGDLFDQERKLAQSGLGDYFDGIEIVSDKSTETYRRIFTQYGDGPDQSMMVGNSMKSDVLPALRAGSWGVFIPHELTWALEREEPPTEEPRYRTIAHLGELETILGEIRQYG